MNLKDKVFANNKQDNVSDKPSVDSAVVFRGDGEPNNPEKTLELLAEFQMESGIKIDSYSLGGTVEELEDTFAKMLGTEAAMFVPTGTLANHLAIRKHCGVKSRTIVQEQSHLYNDTGDSLGRLSSITLVPLAKDRPYFTLDELEKTEIQSKSGRVQNQIGAVVIESPVRRQAGQIVPFNEMKGITDYCRGVGIPSHLDGARLYMMSAATGVDAKVYAAMFDTVYVSLYKYFGAPMGAILAGSAGFIEDMYHDRRMFGAGLKEACIPAALALQGVSGFQERFATAMGHAEELFNKVNDIDRITVKTFENGSNIFPLILDSHVNVDAFIESLKSKQIFVYKDDLDPSHIYLSVNTTVLRKTIPQMLEAFTFAIQNSV